MKGQSLLEVLLGFAIAGIVIGAITIAVISSLNNAQVSRSQNTATGYAQQALETMRQFRNNDVDVFRTFGGISAKTYCFAVSCTKLSSTAGPPCGVKGFLSCGDNLGLPGFTREVKVRTRSSDCIPQPPLTQDRDYYVQVEAFVKWIDGQCPGTTYCHKTQLSTCLN